MDESGWQGVYDLLTAEGFNVSVVQNQTLSLESDVETTTNALDLQEGPAILVGHSYGGAVITEAGAHDSVAGLVYIAAFAPDQGESVSTLIAGFPTRASATDPATPGRVPVPRPPEVRGLVRRRRPRTSGGVHGRLAGPVGSRGVGRRGQRPRLARQADLVPDATDDRMIPPPAQRMMAERTGATTTQAPGSHAIYVSKPDAVADLITRAARSLATTATSVA